MYPICSPAIVVLYEDPSTIVLEATVVRQNQFEDITWKAVAEVRKDGYRIDDITTFSPSGNDPTSETVDMLVVMSK